MVPRPNYANVMFTRAPITMVRFGAFYNKLAKNDDINAKIMNAIIIANFCL